LGALELSSNPVRKARTELPGPFPAKLPQPNDVITASLWLHVAAEKIEARQEVTKPELEALIRLSRTWQAKDPTNAFWRFATAVLLNELGKTQEAQDEWVAAARCTSYDDKQSDHLTLLREGIAQRFLPGSWQYAYVYRLRSVAFAKIVEMYARNLVLPLSLATTTDLRIRYATLVNGGLMLDGSRNLIIMHAGSAVLEMASHPKELRNEVSIKRLLISHSQFKEALKTVGMKAEADKVESIYNEQDSWSALSRREDTDENTQLLTLESSVFPTLPGTMLLVALYGLAIYAAGMGIRRASNQDEKIYQIIAVTSGIALTISALILTHSVLALVATGLACGFALIRPQHTRRRPPEGLGPLFVFANLVLGASFVTVSCVFFLCRTMPVAANSEAFSQPVEVFVNANLMAGFSLIVISLLYLISPMWAMAQRIRTSVIMQEAFRTFGVIVATTGLVLAVVATPLCIYYEHETEHTLQMLVKNEPVYYVGQ